MDIHKQKVLKLISASLWGEDIEYPIDEAIYKDFLAHAIISLPADKLSTLKMSQKIKKQWEYCIIQQLSHYIRYIHEQHTLSLHVPYVILKGTSAAQYYAHPEYRTMGDIDIIVRHEDYEKAYDELISCGYIIKADDEEDHRHISFYKNGIIVELHKYFAKMNDPQKAKILDELIYQNITPEHVLPNMINGLVILEHISQHFESGLGFRQIIDWLMFVKVCLSDKTWPEFKRYTDQLGLTKLAIVITQMCIKYLGLDKQKWCEYDKDLVLDSLVEYIFECGNFGNKHTTDEDNIVYIITRNQSIPTFFKTLQKSGIKNWTVIKKYPGLKPFAWLYQLCRYIYRGTKTNWIRSLNAINKRSTLFSELGVRRESRGIAVYHNGQYIKTNKRR